MPGCRSLPPLQGGGVQGGASGCAGGCASGCASVSKVSTCTPTVQSRTTPCAWHTVHRVLRAMHPRRAVPCRSVPFVHPAPPSSLSPPVYMLQYFKGHVLGNSSSQQLESNEAGRCHLHARCVGVEWFGCGARCACAVCLRFLLHRFLRDAMVRWCDDAMMR